MVVGTTNNNHKTQGSSLPDSGDRVSISSLSELTGFPVDFIKKELLLEDDTLTMEELRASMINFLEHSTKFIEGDLEVGQ